ncbi:conserved hypothetical protein [Treponema primitia ZAS-2]|uniref:Nucleotidyl transferase AbiEii/AbiGii toxin family protein n=1 Tax=Treponema primitia (strain ATCC BAA-887 / DSM 12427 / ZAS-2) TaxID=545694 RepID=F5YN55_TREPZ|nr:nucleotidyl transferase AbiEii/AbiGii toxin family protein [Treponema primitia]AEF83764.1 conserved hypothetical protein [Treponema primitia ZAS-2]AEF85429.1 conserved hypothetical protein [Treponema primitia ZAS-2]
MNTKSPVQIMFEQYHCTTTEERRDALKEIIQEITLAALDRAHFFTHAAFYGGTALRIFHQLDRFSEDLDFSLMEPDSSFDLGLYLNAVWDELGSYGFDMTVETKEKVTDTAVQSAFIKGGTLLHLLKIGSITPPVPGVPPNELIKVKFEVDTNPYPGAGYEVKYGLMPIPYSVRLFDLPSLFAGKLHALLYRSWKSRAKGRDFYDYLWYLSKGIPVNRRYLEAGIRQGGHWAGPEPLALKDILRLLTDRFSSVDYKQIKNDVLPFIRDTRPLDLWSKDFFISLSQEKLRITP